MEEIKKEKEIIETKRRIREPKNFWYRLIKNPIFTKFSITLNIILLLVIFVGVPLGVYPYLGKKFSNYAQGETYSIFRKLFRKSLAKIELETVDYNNTLTRVLLDQRIREKYGFGIMPNWERDQEEVKQAIKILATNKISYRQLEYWICQGPIQPVMGKFSSRIGNRIDPVAKAIGGDPVIGFHRGLDIIVPTGTKVNPFLNGRVVEVGFDDTCDIGKFIAVDHGRGLISYYGHLSSINVKKGQIVSKIQIIGLSGNTGARTTGDHLHFQINLDNKPIDPEKFFEGIVAYF